MTLLAMLRHAPTAWSAEGRLQGRTEVPLSAEGRRALSATRLPPELAEARWHVSPLGRARETAELLGLADPRTEPRLIEMDFGAYEGSTVAELRSTFGAAMLENEARGMRFQPPQGESPAMVLERLRPWLREIAVEGGLHGAVTHKGVIRAALADAYGWPMLGKPPVRLDWACAHLFAVDAEGRLRPQRMNLPLLRVG